MGTIRFRTSQKNLFLFLFSFLLCALFCDMFVEKQIKWKKQILKYYPKS